LKSGRINSRPDLSTCRGNQSPPGSDFENLERFLPRERECVSSVIASEAKQSISPHEERMDCFVASLLAMTVGLFEN
jgi:hypothetical protein